MDAELIHKLSLMAERGECECALCHLIKIQVDIGRLIIALQVARAAVADEWGRGLDHGMPDRNASCAAVANRYYRDKAIKVVR